MASTIAAVTTSGGGVVTTADASGNLNLLAGTTTVVAVTTAGAAVTGTLSATGVATFAAGTVALPSITTSGDTNTGIYFPAADTIAFTEAGTERMRIDSSGNVGIGTTSPVNILSVNGGVSLLPYYETYLANSYYSGSWKYAGNGHAWGIGNNFGGPANGTTIAIAAVNAGGAGAALTWNPVFNIDSSGNLLVGLTSGNADAKVSINAGSTDASPCIDFRKGSATTTTAQVYARFWCSAGAVATGSITANGVSSATFTAYSDKRLKENIVDLPSQLDNIMALRPVEFDFKGYEPGEGHQIGFIAQEVQEIYPDLVGEGTDGMLTLSDMNKNDARLIKCIQEQQALILALTDRIAALEAK